jgi:hypothetical protein
MEIQGQIKKIFPSEYVGANGFEKRDLVIVTEEQYPQTIIIQFTQGRCALLDNVRVGERVRAYINIKGREWTSLQGETKYFNTIECWKIEVVQTTNVANQQHMQQATQQVPAPQPQTFDNNGGKPNTGIINNQEEDDLPF